MIIWIIGGGGGGPGHQGKRARYWVFSYSVLDDNNIPSPGAAHIDVRPMLVRLVS